MAAGAQSRAMTMSAMAPAARRTGSSGPSLPASVLASPMPCAVPPTPCATWPIAPAPELDERDGHADRREHLDDQPKNDRSGGDHGLLPHELDVNGRTVDAHVERWRPLVAAVLPPRLAAPWCGYRAWPPAPGVAPSWAIRPATSR